MATVLVIDNLDSMKYHGADKWVIDDAGRLHITCSKGNAASYNAGSWQSVMFISDSD